MAFADDSAHEGLVLRRGDKCGTSLGTTPTLANNVTVKFTARLRMRLHQILPLAVNCQVFFGHLIDGDLFVPLATAEQGRLP